MLESVRTLFRRVALLALVASVSLTAVPVGAFAVEPPVASERIIGKVAFNGGFAEDAEVSAVAFSYDSVLKSWDAVAASDVTSAGAYALDLPAAGTFRVGFFDAGLVYADRYYAAASKVESGTDIAVAAGAVVEGVDDTMTALPEYLIEGKVAFVGESAPADGVGVTVYSYNTTDGALSLVTRRTKADGTYRIHLPAPDPANGYTGTYRVGFTDFDDVFAPTFFDNAGTVEAATDIAVATAGTVASNVDATLTAQASSRISAANIYNLSVELSSRYEDGSGVPVVLANGASWRDLAVAGPLSHGLGGPLLATDKTAAPQVVLDEITRLGATQVVIVGGPAVVSIEQEYQLREMGIGVVRRIYGNDAFTTATQVANEMVNSGISDAGQLEVAIMPYETPDPSIAAAAVAISGDMPVLFTKKSSLPKATSRFLARVAPTRSLLLGGTTYISSAVAARIPARQQFSGTPAAVGTKFAAFAIPAYGLSNRTVGLVSADKPAEAFVVGTYLASKRITAVSTKAAVLDPTTKSYLVAQKAVVARVLAIGTSTAFKTATYSAAFDAVK